MLFAVEIPGCRKVEPRRVFLFSQRCNILRINVKHNTPHNTRTLFFELRNKILESHAVGKLNEFIQVHLQCPSVLCEHIVQHPAPEIQYSVLHSLPGPALGHLDSIAIGSIALYNDSVGLLEKIFERPIIGTII